MLRSLYTSEKESLRAERQTMAEAAAAEKHAKAMAARTKAAMRASDYATRKAEARAESAERKARALANRGGREAATERRKARELAAAERRAAKCARASRPRQTEAEKLAYWRTPEAAYQQSGKAGSEVLRHARVAYVGATAAYRGVVSPGAGHRPGSGPHRAAERQDRLWPPCPVEHAIAHSGGEHAEREPLLCHVTRATPPATVTHPTSPPKHA